MIRLDKPSPTKPGLLPGATVAEITADAAQSNISGPEASEPLTSTGINVPGVRKDKVGLRV